MGADTTEAFHSPLSCTGSVAHSNILAEIRDETTKSGHDKWLLAVETLDHVKHDLSLFTSLWH